MRHTPARQFQDLMKTAALVSPSLESKSARSWDKSGRPHQREHRETANAGRWEEAGPSPPARAPCQQWTTGARRGRRPEPLPTCDPHDQQSHPGVSPETGTRARGRSQHRTSESQDCRQASLWPWEPLVTAGLGRDTCGHTAQNTRTRACTASGVRARSWGAPTPLPGVTHSSASTGRTARRALVPPFLQLPTRPQAT